MTDTNEKSVICIKMFGFFDVSYKGRSIFLESGANLKPVSILRFLLAQKGKAFIPETIAENIWPENEYMDEKKVVRTYIHRLRKILGGENVFKKDFTPYIAVFNIKGNYKLELGSEVEMDTEIFERLREAALSESDGDKLIDTFKQLTEIYTGEFIEDSLYDHWVIMFRNYYLRTFCSIANAILEKLMDLGRYGEMISICEKSLQLYDFDESINVFFLKALAATDQISSALKHYSFITSKMYNDLSILPSEKMRKLYNEIKSTSKNTAYPKEQPLGDIMDSQSLWIMINEAVKNHMSVDENKYSVGLVEITKNTMGNSHQDTDIGSFGTPNEEYENENDYSYTQPPRVPQDKEVFGGENSADRPNAAAYDKKLLNYLKQALEYALRKNDMYTVHSEHCAVLVLYDARPEFYQKICNRICQAFYSRVNGFEYKISVKILKLTVIN